MNTNTILQVAESLALEKGIQREDVIGAIEMAIQKAARAKYGFDKDIRATMDRMSGEITLVRCREVVETVQDEVLEISLDDVQIFNKNIKVGEVLEEPLPPIDFGRVAAQTARQVIVQHLRDVERSQHYDAFKDRVGEVMTGIVRRIEYGNVFVDLGKTEGILRRNDIIPRESLRVGDRVKAYIWAVRRETHGPQVFLSRTHPQFLIALFKQEVPEVDEGVIEIKRAARDPGSRAKVSVYTADSSVDPVGCCVGMRGARVQAVINELQGEKIDIIPWSPDIATFIVNALIPAEVSKVILDENNRKIEVVVAEEHLSKAIGRRGQNVRLASQLTEVDLDVITESQESERREKQIKERSNIFMSALDVDELIARVLVAEGFANVEDIAFVPEDELASIDGFDEDVAKELRQRALDHLKKEEDEVIENYENWGLQEDLVKLPGMTPRLLMVLSKKKIRTRNALADLCGEELVEIVGPKVSLDLNQANEIIMAARSHWFEQKSQG